MCSFKKLIVLHILHFIHCKWFYVTAYVQVLCKWGDPKMKFLKHKKLRLYYKSLSWELIAYVCFQGYICIYIYP